MHICDSFSLLVVLVLGDGKLSELAYKKHVFFSVFVVCAVYPFCICKIKIKTKLIEDSQKVYKI